MYNFTKNWFGSSEIKTKLLNLVDTDKKNKILEIGCFEGQSSTFFADNLLNFEGSLLICVDPFYKSGTVEGITSSFVNNNVKERFLCNIKKSKGADKIIFHNKTSDDFFQNNTTMFNFIYIDGCHGLDYIERDMKNSFKFLEKGGIMWMDDYGGGRGTEIKDTMNKFLEKYKGQYKLIHKGYQLAIKKSA